MIFANINNCWSYLIIEELSRLGVGAFCIAPGSRSSPLVIAVAQNKKVKSKVHFDERGLSFYAMGHVAGAKKPAVLICTSGTAAANFFPAIIEASKKKLPLIVITADRPPELRQTGAVQTIDQVGLYGKYVQWAVDMPCPERAIKPEFVLTTLDQAYYQAIRKQGVVHINCMFRPPLTLLPDQQNLKDYTQSLEDWFKSNEPFTQYVTGFESVAMPIPKKIASLLDKIKNGLIVVGKLAGPREAELVLALAKKLGWPIFADITSGLRLGSTHAQVIGYFDLLLGSEVVTQKLSFDGVLHLGGRMTSQRYYDFIKNQDLQAYMMVLNHPLRNDPNHQVTLRLEMSVANFIETVSGLIKPRVQSPALKLLSKTEIKADDALKSFFKQNMPLSELQVARLVSQLIPQNHGLFLSNSMPIRDMGNFADAKGQKVIVNANRGASGIDGIIASAAGFAEGLDKPVTLMIGDLAALHDLNSLALLRDLHVPLIIILLNNGGGGIFSFLPIADFKEGFEKFWGTPHSYTLASAAAMFELNYFQPMDVNHFKKAYLQAVYERTSTIIEIITNRADNLKTHQQLTQIMIP